MISSTKRVQGTPRPLVPLALGLLIGVVFAGRSWLDPKLALVASGMLVCIVRHPTPRLWATAVALLGVSCGLWRVEQTAATTGDDISLLARDGPQLVRVSGVLMQDMQYRAAVQRNTFLPYEPRATTRFVLDVRRCNGVPRAGRIAVTVAGTCYPLPPGTPISIVGWLEPPPHATNPGQFDWAGVLRGRGIACVLRSPATDLLQGCSLPEKPRDALLLLRGRCTALLDRYALPEAGARLMQTLVLGQRTAADASLNDAFARTGSLHYLAVSGFHVGVLLLLTWSALRCLTRSLWIAPLGASVVLLGYAAIAEPNPPILRATTLGVLWCLAQWLGRGRCSENWLGGAALLLLWIAPAQLWRPGFQLSFLQVLMLIQMRGLLGRVPNWEAQTWPGVVLWILQQRIRQWLLVAALSWITAAPLVAWHFGRLAPWGALQSALLMPLVVLTFGVGVLALLAAPLPGAASVLTPVVQTCSGWLLSMVAWLGRVPHPLVEVPAPAPWQLALLYAALACCLLGRLRVRYRALGAAVCVLMCLLPTGASPLTDRLCVLDVGAGSAALWSSAHGTVVFDIGTRSNFDCSVTVSDAVRALKLPAPREVWISHDNLDHYSGMPGLLAQSAQIDVIGNARSAERFAGRSVTQGVHGEIEVLWPPEDLPDWVRENDRSLVLRIRCGNQTVLLPGDIEDYAMRQLLALEADGTLSLASDVLIAPHHGSTLPKQTRAFYRAASPRLVIASSDRARPGLRALLDAVGLERSQLLVTAEVGAVTLEAGPSGGVVRVGAAQRATAGPAAGRAATGGTADRSARR